MADYRLHPEDLPAEPERDSSTSERGAGYFLSGLLPPLWRAPIPPSFSPAHGYDWLGLTPPRARIRVTPSTPALTSCLASLRRLTVAAELAQVADLTALDRLVAGPGGSDPTKSCTRSAPAIRPARPLSRFTAATDAERALALLLRHLRDSPI